MSETGDVESRSDVTFEAPPEPRTPRYNWQRIRDQLVSKPYEWAKVFDDDRASLVTAIRIGGIRAMRKSSGIEIRTTNNVREPERRCTLWARYRPDWDEPDEESN